MKAISKKFTIRLTYLVISFIIAGIAWYFHDTVLPSNYKALDLISYVGTVVTLIGFIITGGEIFNSMSISQAVGEEVKKVSNYLADLNSTQLISDLSNTLDTVIQLTNNEEYNQASIYFKIFRRNFAKIELPNDDIKAIESKLLTASRGDSRFSKAQKNELKELLLQVKPIVEDFQIKILPNLNLRLREKSNDTKKDS